MSLKLTESYTLYEVTRCYVCVCGGGGGGITILILPCAKSSIVEVDHTSHYFQFHYFCQLFIASLKRNPLQNQSQAKYLLQRVVTEALVYSL